MNMKHYRLECSIPVLIEIYVLAENLEKAKATVLELWNGLIDLSGSFEAATAEFLDVELVSKEELLNFSKPIDELDSDQIRYATKLQKCLNNIIRGQQVYYGSLKTICTTLIKEPISAKDAWEAIENFYEDENAFDNNGLYDGYFYEDPFFDGSDFIFTAQPSEMNVRALPT